MWQKENNRLHSHCVSVCVRVKSIFCVCVRLHSWVYMLKKELYLIKKALSAFVYVKLVHFLLKTQLKWIYLCSFIHAKCEMLLHVHSELRNCIKFLSFLIHIDRNWSQSNRHMLKCAHMQKPLLSMQCPKILEWWNHCRHTSLVDSAECWLKVLTNQFYELTCQYFALRPLKTHAHTQAQTQTRIPNVNTAQNCIFTESW